jgi:predicted DNA-binding protein
MALSIASAFRLRNKLKERIKRLSEITGRAETTKPEGDGREHGYF